MLLYVVCSVIIYVCVDAPEYVCDGPHEYYETCESSTQVADDSCVVGCRCQNDYARNDKGKCIAKNKCK